MVQLVEFSKSTWRKPGERSVEVSKKENPIAFTMQSALSLRPPYSSSQASLEYFFLEIPRLAPTSAISIVDYLDGQGWFIQDGIPGYDTV